MTNEKHAHIDQLRFNTAYPTYRGAATVLTILGYLWAAFKLGVGVIGAVQAARGSLAVAVTVLFWACVSALVTLLLTRLFRGAGMILADIADSVTERNSSVPEAPKP
ncbi:hypothetical protein BH09SUM1_BH09SUM1_26980 [soil metagenome]